MRTLPPLPPRFMNPLTGDPLCSGSGNFEYRGPMVVTSDPKPARPTPPGPSGPAVPPKAPAGPYGAGRADATQGALDLTILGPGMSYAGYLYPGAWFGCVW